MQFHPTLLEELLREFFLRINSCLVESGFNGSENMFISHCEPTSSCCDYISGSLSRIYETTPQTFPSPKDYSKICAKKDFAVKFDFEVMKSCYPTVGSKGEPISFDALDVAGADLLLEMSAIVCCLFNMKEIELTSSTGHPSKVLFDAIEPLCPSGACAGYKFSCFVLITCC